MNKLLQNGKSLPAPRPYFFAEAASLPQLAAPRIRKRPKTCVFAGFLVKSNHYGRRGDGHETAAEYPPAAAGAGRIRSRRDHPTAEQIFQNVHALDPHISRGTVYRNLNLLCDNQEIFRVVMSDCDRFDLRTDPHYHMRCVVCGCVLDVDSPYDREYDAALAQKTGYQILRHRLVVEGICPDCQKKKNRS